MQVLALTQEMSPILLLLDVLLIQAFCDSHVFPNFIIYLSKIMDSRTIKKFNPFDKIFNSDYALKVLELKPFCASTF